jgi:hypothetical protein
MMSVLKTIISNKWIILSAILRGLCDSRADFNAIIEALHCSQP